MTIAKAPATPPPAADLRAPKKSNSVDDEIPRPYMLNARARIGEVKRERYVRWN